MLVDLVMEPLWSLDSWGYMFICDSGKNDIALLGKANIVLESSVDWLHHCIECLAYTPLFAYGLLFWRVRSHKKIISGRFLWKNYTTFYKINLMHAPSTSSSMMSSTSIPVSLMCLFKITLFFIMITLATIIAILGSLRSTYLIWRIWPPVLMSWYLPSKHYDYSCYKNCNT